MVSDTLSSSPALAEDCTTVAVGLWDKHLAPALDLSSGNELWRCAAAGPLWS